MSFRLPSDNPISRLLGRSTTPSTPAPGGNTGPQPTGTPSTRSSVDGLPTKSVVGKREKFPDGSKRPDRPVQTGPRPQTAKERLQFATWRKTNGHLGKGAMNDFQPSGFVMPADTYAQATRAEKKDPNNPKAWKPAHSDSHMHDSNYVQRGLTMKQKLAYMDKIGIRNCVSMPIPTSLISLPGNRQAIQPGALYEHLYGHKPGTQHDHAPGHQADHGHNCGTLESYYVPTWAVQQVRDAKNDPSIKNLTLEHFQEFPALLPKIIEAGELYVDTRVNAKLKELMQKADLSDAERSRIDPMMTGLHLGDPRVGDIFLEELHLHKGTFTGIGEITVDKELVKALFAGKGQANVQQKLEPLRDLMEKAGIVGAPVVLHCDIDGLDYQIDPKTRPADLEGKPSNLEGLASLFQDPRVKDTKIVWAHGGGLGRFVQQGPGHLDHLQDLLDKCPNLHLDISWDAVATQLTKPEEMAAWAAFIEKNSDRICLGSDTLSPKSEEQWAATYNMYNEKGGLFDRLSPQAKENVLNGTYDKVFVESRAKVREAEELLLTDAFFESHQHNHNDADGNNPQRLDAGMLRDRLAAARQQKQEADDAAKLPAKASRLAQKLFHRTPAAAAGDTSSAT